jgi:hypothetical protein
MKIFPIELEEDLHRRMKHAAIDSGMTLHAWIIKTLKTTINYKDVASKRAKKPSDGGPDKYAH